MSGTAGTLGGGGLRLPDFFGGGGGAGGLGPAPIPQAFMTAQIGQRTQPAGWGRIRDVGRVRDVTLAGITGLSRSTDFNAPIMGPTSMAWRYFNSSRTYFTPTAHPTAFHEFFGLTPSDAPVDLTQVAPRSESVSVLLARKTDDSISRMLARALEAFKLATAEGKRDNELLSRARWALRVARDLDPDAHIASLLLVHAALGQQQVASAVTYLADAARRHPVMFVEWPDLASYYGDPQRLEREVRPHLRAGDQQPTAENYALQAYCAWVLGDKVRARDALERIEEVTDPEAPVDTGLTAFRHALAAALLK
jgi:hypothetical protein